jgi:hypothetical protein
MFKNKYIQQLQYVQGHIKKCKASITNLKPPSPPTLTIGRDIDCWFHALFHQYDPAMSDLIESYTLKNESIDYLRTLGEYLIGVADYYQDEIKYAEELKQLQKEERILKEKLGIN